jgi:hypothetical protein
MSVSIAKTLLDNGILNPKFALHRQEIARKVAEETGFPLVPYPKCPAIDAFIKWSIRSNHEKLLLEELEDAKTNGTSSHEMAQIKREIESVRKRIRRLKVPAGYQSWEHLQALCEFRDTLSVPPAI